MRRGLRFLGIAALALLAIVAAHMLLIEVGREVVTLRTPRPDGSWKTTRLWIVDDGGTPWLHSGGEDWIAQFEDRPIVELDRGGATHRYRGTLVPGPHPRVHELLRAKYGVADRWVRLIGPDAATTIPVRLDPP
jgi:hypothetical protein